MNKANMKTIGCALTLALLPLSANAVSESKALEACASALASEISGDTGVETSYRLDEGMPVNTRRLRDVGLFHLDAHDPESREVVARADCWVTRRARVTRLVPVPIDAGDATQRATALY